MALSDLTNILNIFGGKECSEAEKEDLFRESLLMTLSRATSADSNIDPAEVETVRDVIKGITGQDIGGADVRVAATSALYEKASLEKYLSKAAKTLTPRQGASILNGLADVIRSDSQVREAEVAFFNKVASALAVTPAQLAGIIANAP